MSGVSAQATKIHLAIAAWDCGSYFRWSRRLEGHPADASRQLPTPRSGDGAGQDQRRPASAHDLHHRKTPCRKRCGCADALMYDWRALRRRSAPAPTFSDQGRQVAYANARLLSRRHHPAHRVIALAKETRLRGDPSAPFCPMSSAAFPECFIVGTAAEVTPVLSEIGPHRYTPARSARRFDPTTWQPLRQYKDRRRAIARGGRRSLAATRHRRSASFWGHRAGSPPPAWPISQFMSWR